MSEVVELTEEQMREIKSRVAAATYVVGALVLGVSATTLALLEGPAWAQSAFIVILVFGCVIYLSLATAIVADGYNRQLWDFVSGDPV